MNKLLFYFACLILMSHSLGLKLKVRQIKNDDAKALLNKMITLAKGGSTGATTLTVKGGDGNALQDNKSVTNIGNSFLKGAVGSSGQSGQTISGLGQGTTATSGDNQIALGPSFITSKSTNNAASIMDILNGMGKSASISLGGSALTAGATTSTQKNENSSTSQVQGTGSSQTAAQSDGTLSITDTTTSGDQTSQTAGQLDINDANSQGTLDTTDNNEMNLTQGDTNASSSTVSNGSATITGAGSASTVSSSNNSIQIISR
jgi:hypothetical protein